MSTCVGISVDEGRFRSSNIEGGAGSGSARRFEGTLPPARPLREGDVVAAMK
jgi:hypothetical protein